MHVRSVNVLLSYLSVPTVTSDIFQAFTYKYWEADNVAFKGVLTCGQGTPSEAESGALIPFQDLHAPILASHGRI
ncbi:hypothetical protein B0H21DRAFT_735332 [Amylocystis lapponica]|nr:hypothetical protein B0H21DRAFT_735332 [Amylocystis lapponica]